MKRVQRAALAAAIALAVSGFSLTALRWIDAPVKAAIQASATTSEDPGAASYAKQCAICHGDHREGILPAFPPILGIKHQMTDQQITEVIRKGKGRMPGFPQLKDQEVAALLHYLGTAEVLSPTAAAVESTQSGESHASGLIEAGGSLFRQNCAFCHGRDAMGGETGPDLTQSKLVQTDVNGDKISPVIREGRIEKKMPAFNFSSDELLSLVAFIHAREAFAALHKGGRRGVEVSDLQTGNVQAGKAYFNGAGTCSKCHSPTGDLAGVATRFQGLQLEERMLYPRDAKSKVTVTLSNGQQIEGILAYRDEFVIGLRDADGAYHSWLTRKVKFKVDSPVDAHVELFPRYTDDDIHNLMAYLQTLH